MSAPRQLLSSFVAVVLAGCVVGPTYVKPSAPSGDRYAPTHTALPLSGPADPQQHLSQGTPVADRWWQAFGSDALNGLVDQAVAASPTLDTTRATLAEARETLLAARGAYYPQLDVSASATHENRASTQSSGPNATRPAANVFSVGPLVTFPLDLFGSAHRNVEERSALVDVQRYQYAAAYLSLTGSVVTQAINTASAAEQLTAAGEIVAIDERNLELAKLSAAAGKSAQLDVLSATSQLASDRTLLPPLHQQQDLAIDALSVLAGTSPAQWTPPDLTLSTLTLPLALPLSLPSELVHHRPDIQAAEAQLHANNAAIGVAVAQLYPSVTLDGSWMRESTHAGVPLLDSSINLWSAAANLTAPLFHGGALRAQRRAAIDAYAAQLGTYQQTVLQAFGQVSDSLRALTHDAQTLEAERGALDATLASLHLTQEGYEAGQASLLQVLDAQRLYQQARLGYARAQGQRYLDTAQLYIAMGGAAPTGLR